MEQQSTARSVGVDRFVLPLYKCKEFEVIFSTTIRGDQMPRHIPFYEYLTRTQAEKEVRRIVRRRMRIVGIREDAIDLIDIATFFTADKHAYAVRCLVINQLLWSGFPEDEAEAIYSAIPGDLMTETRVDIVKRNHHLDEFMLAIAVANILIRHINENV